MNNEQLLFYNKGFNDCLRRVIDTNLAKTLTDEEIWELAQPHGDLAWQDCTLDFARAILKKAQENDLHNNY